MTRATTPRAKKTRDWAALLQAVRNEEASVTPEARAVWLAGKWSDPRPSNGEAYVDAMQTALEARDYEPLLSMLDGGMYLPDALLPTLAEVIRDARLGLSSGRPATLTEMADEAIRFGFDHHTVRLKMPKGQVQQHLADTFKVSVDTIKRSLKRTKT